MARSQFSRWRLIIGVAIMIASGWGILQVRQYLDQLSLDDLGPLATITGTVESIEAEGNRLELSIDNQIYLSVGPFPKQFYRRNLVKEEVTSGDLVTLTVPEEAEGDRIDFYGLRSQGIGWLTPEGHLAWQRANSKAGLRLLWFVFITGGLIFVSGYRPLGNHLESVADQAVWRWVVSKSWVASIIFLLASIPASKACWLSWKMRNHDFHEGVVIQREETKWLGTFTQFPLTIQPEGSDLTVRTLAKPEVPDEVTFRWDGEATEVFLDQYLPSPWTDLLLLLGLALASLLISQLYRLLEKLGNAP